MRPFADEVAEAMVYYRDMVRAHGMDWVLKEAVATIIRERRDARGRAVQVQMVEAERDALRTRVAEVEAQMAEAAHVLGLAASLLRECRLYKGYDHGPALQPAVDIVLRQAKRVLSSSAGRETAERLRLLEELAEAATAFVERCTIVECLPRTEDAICDEDPCLKQRLKAAVKALRGGQGDNETRL